MSEARSRAQVKEVHAAVLVLGGLDEGAPAREAKTADTHFFRDPEGNEFLIHRAGPSL
jgi:hypothetical protein